MIVVVGGVKGGTGKTTIATNLAVLRSRENKKVLLVDADEQQSTTTWASQRDVMGIPTSWVTIQLTGKAVYSQLEKMRNDYDDIIVDVGGRETRSLRAAIAIADIFVIPFQPRSFDIWTIGDVKSIIAEMKQVNDKLQCVALINRADFSGNDNDDTLNIIQECDDIECFQSPIKTRKAFANAASDGLGVCEMQKPDPKAIQEITALYDFLYNKCTASV